MSTPMSPEDLYRFRWLDHVRLSPEGERVAYQVGWADAEARENRGAIVVQRLSDGSEPVSVAGSDHRCHFPEWSPDGQQLAFLGRCGTRDQLFAVSAEGGQCTQLTDLPDGVTAPRWSPDGRHIAFLARQLSEPEGVVDDPRPPESPNQTRRPPVVRATARLDYKRDGTGFLDGRRPHLFVVEPKTGELRPLTDGAWSVEGFDWAPDGRTLAVTGNADPDADLRRESHLHLVGLDGARHALVRSMKISEPAWSPAGDLIAFLAPTGDASGLHERVWVVPSAGGQPRCLTLGLDRACDGDVLSDMRAGHSARLLWSEAGDRLFFQAGGPGAAELCSVDLDGVLRTELAASGRTVYSFDVRRGRAAACISDPTSPGEVVVVEAGGERRLTDANPWLQDRFVAVPERQEFVAEDGLPIEGWLMRPADHDSSRRHPLILEVHGGPHAQYGWTFFHEFQVLAGMGFLVLFVNPRGSDGYGESFKRSVVRDWGGADYRDLMGALDQLIARTGFVDEDRLGVAGGSYGGYMTNWMIGQSDRFAAAVAMRSISNLVSDYAQHDIVPWAREELGAPPWESLDELWRRSPIRYADRIRTPLLLLHSEMDLRCPVSQAEELFGALRLLGREVAMVRFPGESHDLSRSGRPDRRVERLRRIADWFARHLLKGEAKAPASGAESAPTP